MPVTVSWADDEHTIVMNQYDGLCTLDEVHQAITAGYNLIHSVPHEVDSIIYYTKGSSVRSNDLLSVTGRLERQRPPNLRQTVVVGSPRFLKVLFEVVKKTAPRVTENVTLVNTLDEAWALIRQKRNQVT